MFDGFPRVEGFRNGDDGLDDASRTRSQKDKTWINRMYSNDITTLQDTQKRRVAENKVQFHYQSTVDLSPETSYPRFPAGPNSSSSSARETSASIISLSVSSPAS